VGRFFLTRPKSREQETLREWPTRYLAALRALGRKHKIDDEGVVTGILNYLKTLQRELSRNYRGEMWIPEPDPHTGYYPMLNRMPYEIVKRAIRKNTGPEERLRAWAAIKAGAQPFLALRPKPTFPGMNERQAESLMEALAVSVPLTKGRYPSLLGKVVPGQIELGSGGGRSIIPIRRLSPEDWQRGFTMRKFSLKTGTTLATLRKQMYASEEEYRNALDALKKRLKPPGRLLHSIRKGIRVAGKHKRLIGAGLIAASSGAGYIAGRKRSKRRVKLGSFEGQVLRHVPGFQSGYITGKVEELERKLNRQRHSFASEEMVAYTAGFRYGLRDRWQNIKSRIWQGARPEMMRGAVLGGLGAISQEFDVLPPMTVDNIAVRRHGFKSAYAPYSNIQLSELAEKLQTRASLESDPAVQKGLYREVANLLIEVEARRSV